MEVVKGKDVDASIHSSPGGSADEEEVVELPAIAMPIAAALNPEVD